MPEQDSGETASPKISRWLLGIAASVIATVLGAVIVPHVVHPAARHAQIEVLNWSTTDRDSSAATASVTVHNDGDGSAEGCTIHWVALDDAGKTLGELATSSSFGLAPGATYPSGGSPAVLTSVFNPPGGPTVAPRLGSLEIITTIYVQCGERRFSSNQRLSVRVFPD